MWVLPSRSRPHNVARLLKAFEATGATTPVWLRLDDDDPMMMAYNVPCHCKATPWQTKEGPRLPLSAIYNEAYTLFADAPWYGFIADDVVPETWGWDKTLIHVAGKYGMAVPAGGHDSDGTPHFVLGGELVRSIGWLALPGLDRLFIDTAWADIARKRGVLRLVPEVVLVHHHFSNGKALFDSIYHKHRKAEDRAIYRAWRG